MANRFVHFENKATFTSTSNYETVYDKSIVFIKDTQEIWTHGTYYAIPDTYKNKITSLESAVKALQDLNANAFAYKNVKVGNNTITASSGKETLTIANGKDISVSLDTATQTVTIASTYSPTVAGVKSGDKVLALDGTDIKSTLSITYDKTAKAIKLFGIDQETPISTIDATDFIKDGMLSDAKFDPDTKKLTLTFNTDSGKEKIDVDLTSLVDTYDGSNLKLKSVTVPEIYTEPTSEDSVDSAISALIKGVREAKASAGVTKFGGQVGDITVDDSTTTSGAVKFAMSGTKLTGTVVDGVTAAGTLTADTLVVGAGSKGVKVLTSGTEGQVLSVGESGLEWKNISDSDTTYTFANGTDGSFNVTPKNGQAQKVSIGKPATAGTADKVANAATIKLNGSEGIVYDGSAAKELDITADKIGAATAAQGTKADSAIQTIRATNTGTYVSVAGAKSGTEIQLTPSVTIQAISTASSSAKGLAEASDVKSYVDDLFDWEEK